MSSVSPQLLNVKPTLRSENAMTSESDSTCTNVQLPMAFQANQQLFAEMAQHVGMHLQPSKSGYTHTQTDPAARVFKPSQAKVFALQTTIPSKTTVNDHMEPTKYQHCPMKAIVNSKGDRSENVLNISYSHSSHSPHSKLNRDMQKLVATISTRVLAKVFTYIFLAPAIHTRIVAFRGSRVLVS
jgi:hypothetical protein